MSDVSAMRSASSAVQVGGSRAQEEARADRNQAQERRAEEAETRRHEERQRAARADQAGQQQAVQQERQVSESQGQRLEMEARQGRGQIVDTLV